MSEPARILLVVTGKLEEVALGDALHRVFPSAYFGVTRTQGFTATSPRLSMPTPEYDDSRAREIVEDLVAAASPHEPGARAYDYAVAVEDVELINEADKSEAGTRDADEGIRCILEHVKLGVDVVLRHEEQKTVVLPKGKAKRAPSVATDEDRRRFLRERCSFHLLRPLAEALFFGERAALERAADGAKLPPVHFDPIACDIEAFATTDPVFLAKPDGEVYWATKNRRRHPKHYLEYLLDPNATPTARKLYKETRHGKRALASLDWQTVVAPPLHAQMVRALLDDIADMLGAPLPWRAAGVSHPLTQRRDGGRLRNVV
jgi:hypothetical protein